MNWQQHLDSCLEESTRNKWKPFPEHYVDLRNHFEFNIPQLPPDEPKVHVIAKLSDNFEMLQQYGTDDAAVPPKVYCWTDVAPLTSKMARKAIKAGLESEYRSFSEGCTIAFQSVSSGNHDPLPMPDEQPDVVVFHVVDPTQGQKNKGKKMVNKQTIPTSFSSSALSAMMKGKGLPGKTGGQTHETPIQLDLETLEDIANSIEDCDATFVFDCSFGVSALRAVQVRGKPIFGFAVTASEMLCTSQLPSDLLTSCLLTPARIALLWQSQRYSAFGRGLLSQVEIQNLIEMLEGSSEAKAMLDMVDKALEAVADAIAYDALRGDISLFYKVFRRNQVVARFFYHFMLGERILYSMSMTPESYPHLPDTSTSPLWDVFDLEVDRALFTIREALKPSPNRSIMFSMHDMLEEAMQRLESWLEFKKKDRETPREIGFLPLLIQHEEFFSRAIGFSYEFLAISEDATKLFLHTRCFPLLISHLEHAADYEPDIVACLSFVIADSILVSPQLRRFFQNSLHFWLEQVQDEHVLLLTSCLTCLLVLLDSEEKIELYKENGLVDVLTSYLNHESNQIRCLATLLLAGMKIPLEYPMGAIRAESDPLCKSAIIARVATTLEQSRGDESVVSDELLFEFVTLMGNLSSLVRQEVFVAISHFFAVCEDEFVESLTNFVRTKDEDEVMSPVIPLLVDALRISFLEPSVVGGERLAELLEFLSNKFKGKAPVPLSSRLKTSLLKRLAHSERDEIVPEMFASEELTGNKVAFAGSPAISPSGLLACADVEGKMFCQVNSENGRTRCTYDYFSTKISPDCFGEDLSKLALDCAKPNVSYLRYIDDERILAVSDNSEVVVIDSGVLEDAVCSFWVQDPTKSCGSLADYNSHSFHLIHTDHSQQLSIYDLELQSRISQINLQGDKPVSRLQFFRPYSTLFYVGQGSSLTIFDSRMRRSVAAYDLGASFIGCNISSTLPFYMILATEKGLLTMIDMREMSVIASRGHKEMTQFDVHKHLPFACGICEGNLISFSYESGGELTPEIQHRGGGVEGFELHHSEYRCAIRSNSRVQCIDISY